jgi:acyl carrier protein
MREDQVLTGVVEVVGATVGIDPGRVTPQARLDEDLGIDSLTLVDVVVALEDQFGLVIPDDDWSRFHTIGDIPRICRRRLSSDGERRAARGRTVTTAFVTVLVGAGAN